MLEKNICVPKDANILALNGGRKRICPIHLENALDAWNSKGMNNSSVLVGQDFINSLSSTESGNNIPPTALVHDMFII